MLKKIIFLCFIFSIHLLCAQDTISAKQARRNKITTNKHIIGLDIGYGSYREIFHSDYYNKENFDYYGELNLNYICNPHKNFFSKIQGSFAPTKHFGIISRAATCIGFTTSMKKTLAWHLAVGACIGGTSKNYIKIDNYSYSNYALSLGVLFIETGFYLKLFKSKNHFLGINFSTTTFSMKNNYRYYTNGFIGFTNVSYNIQFNKTK